MARFGEQHLRLVRELGFEPGFTKHAEGSCLVRFGDTHVLCTASLEEKPVDVIEAAYNDAAGVTRDFTLNLLAAIPFPQKTAYHPVARTCGESRAQQVSAGRVSMHGVLRVLLALLVLPLEMPVLIFGARAVDLAMHGEPVAGPLNLLAALLLFFVSLGPFAMAAAMRISVES